MHQNSVLFRSSSFMAMISIIPTAYLSKVHSQTHAALEMQQLALLWIPRQQALCLLYEHLRTLGWIETLLNLVSINGRVGMQ